MHSTDKTKVVVLARVCPVYRHHLFKRISQLNNINFKLIIGADIPDTKVRSIPTIEGYKHTKLKTRYIRIFRRIFLWHYDLIQELNKFSPDVIICEGESNIITYIRTLFYRMKHSEVKLIHWSLGGLPGRKDGIIVKKLKYYTRKHFDAFIVYSTYGKECLIKSNLDGARIFVATNVCETITQLPHPINKTTKNEIKKELNINSNFIVLYVGAIDDNKNLDKILDVAKKLNNSEFCFYIVGDGPYLEALSRRTNQENIPNIFFTGSIKDGLVNYYLMADLFYLPGRGGMVISEAMNYGLPCLVYKADGTEYDLIKDNKTGFMLQNNDTDNICKKLIKLKENNEELLKIGRNARTHILDNCNSQAMASNIKKAIDYVA